MRLLDTRTGRFRWVEDPREVRFAILSHVWSRDPNNPEQTYQDVLGFQEKAGDGPILDQLSDKVRRFCEIALENGFELGWADSCCIDKTSSSELSEAINSMYDWYRYAAVCYAFLHDVGDSPNDADAWKQEFCDSEWFTRGWTLQELLAPTILLFLSKTWDVKGSKQTLATLVETITGIDRAVLTFERSLEEVSIARKMSWAASRKTSREEDRAYSLMGIFGVSIPITYGEGRYAFIRLQEEIIRVIPDQSIFAWGPFLRRHSFELASPDDAAVSSMLEPPSLSLPSTSSQYLLASSPGDFEHSSRFIHLSREAFAERLGILPVDAYQVFSVTAYGMHTRLPLIAVVSKGTHDIIPTHLALLACEDQKDGRLLALLLRPHVQSSGTGFSVGTVVGKMPDLVAANALASTGILLSSYYRATYLSLQEVQQCLRRRFFRMANVYIPHRPSRIASENERDESFHTALRDDVRDAFEVRLSGWSRKLLTLQGYMVSIYRGAANANIALENRPLNATLAAGVTIANDSDRINIQIGRCNCLFGSRLLGVLVWSRNAECSLEQQFMEDRHLMNHPAHIPSWDFRGGIASTRVHLYPHSSPKKRITLRLTFCRDASVIPRVPGARAYQLGVEVTTSEDNVARPSPAEAEARERRLEDISRTYPGSHSPVVVQPHSDGSTFLSPSDRPRIQRARSNSETTSYIQPFDGDDSQKLSPSGGLPPSPPITADNSRTSDGLPPWYQRSVEQHQPPHNHDAQAAHGNHRNHRYERSGPTAPIPPGQGQKPTQRKSSLWTPAQQQPAGWGGSQSPLVRRQRSLDDPRASARFEDSHASTSTTTSSSSKDDSYLVRGYRLQSGQEPVRPQPRTVRSDDERRLSGYPAAKLGNGAPGVRSLREQNGGPSSYVPDFKRSESPKPLAGDNLEGAEFGRHRRRPQAVVGYAPGHLPDQAQSSSLPVRNGRGKQTGFQQDTGPSPPSVDGWSSPPRPALNPWATPIGPDRIEERRPTGQRSDSRHQNQPWPEEWPSQNAARIPAENREPMNEAGSSVVAPPSSAQLHRDLKPTVVPPPEIRINPPSPPTSSVSRPVPVRTVSQNGEVKKGVERDSDRATPTPSVPVRSESSTGVAQQRPPSDRQSNGHGGQSAPPSATISTTESGKQEKTNARSLRKALGRLFGKTSRT